MKLSIIVPVYNMAASQKLNFCLDSLVNQTISDYEIIAVDDASTDDSLNILRTYQNRFPDKFQIISYPQNRHQGGARNEGLKAAKGEWIGFIDSDDWITPDYYEKLINKAEQTGADVVGCHYNIVNTHTFECGQIVKTNTVDQCGEMNEELRKRLLLHFGSMVIKVYKKSLIDDNKLCFPEGIFYEDNCAAPIWSMYIRHFELVDEPLYYYYQHDASTVHTIDISKCYDRITAMELMLAEVKECGFYDSYKNEIEYLFTNLYLKNTLFSYMLGKKEKGISFVRELKRGILSTFPSFRENPYYIIPDEEERKMIDLFMSNTFFFYLYYSALWFYRKHIRTLLHR